MPTSDIYGFVIDISKLPQELERLKKERIDDHHNLDMELSANQAKMARYTAAIRELEYRIERLSRRSARRQAAGR